MLITPSPYNDWQYASAADIADTNAVEAVAAVTGYRHRVTDITLNNTDATVSTLVQIRSGTTVLWTGFLENFVTAAPGGGTQIDRSFVRPLKGDSGGNINVICVTTSAQVRASICGYTEKA
jgi:hypothetical protein